MKYIIIKLGFVALALIAANSIYVHVQLGEDIEAYCPQLEDIKMASEADVIYLGDCSDVYCRGNCDVDTSISSQLQYLMPDRSVFALSKNGYTPEVYLRLLRRISEVKISSSKTLIVTLNLRAFADHIINDPYYLPVINQQLIFTDPLPAFANRARLSFDLVPKPSWAELYAKTMEAQSNTLMTVQGQSISARDWIRNFEADSIGESYLNDYAFQFQDAQMRRLKAYEDIVALARAQGWEVVLHFVPINFDGIERYVGNDLLRVTMKNKQFLLNHFEGHGAKVIDNSTMLPLSDFLHVLSNSHYNTRAKRRLARSINQQIFKY